jgi:hypothetical protein
VADRFRTRFEGYRRAIICVETGASFQTSFDAANAVSTPAFPVAPNEIVACCRGIIQRVAGFRWRFAEPRAGELDKGGKVVKRVTHTVSGIVLFQADGTTLHYRSITVASAATALSIEYINDALARLPSSQVRAMYRHDYFDGKPIPWRTDARKIECIDTKAIYPSVEDAERFIRTIHRSASASNIIDVCEGRRLSAGRLKWKYADAPAPERVRIERSNQRPIVGINENGEVFRFTSVASATRGQTRHNAGIYLVLSGKRPRAYGMQWLYADDYDNGIRPAKPKDPKIKSALNRPPPRSVLLTNKDGTVFRFASVNAASTALHIETRRAYDAICRRRRTAGGYKWAYE